VRAEGPFLLEKQYKQFANFKLLAEGNGGFEGYASLFGVRDDGGDVVEQGAFTQTVPSFVKNGFISLGHDWDELPIGVIVEAREDDKGLFIRTQYHSTTDAQDARKVAQERMNLGKSVALSIGYGVKPGGAEMTPDGMTRRLMALDLYEVSQVNVPMLRPAGLTSVKEGRRNSSSDQRIVQDAHDMMVTLGAQCMTGDGKGLKAAIGSHSTATSDSSWDGPDIQSRLSNDAGAATYRKAAAWVDPDKDADTKAAYRFWHHFVGADGSVGAASTVACSTGIAVLNGGRGGTTIPDADKQGVWNHLARHLRDADKEPPPLKSATRLRLSDHTEHVLADVQGLAGRLGDLESLRAGDGRGLSKAQLEVIDELVGALNGLRDGRKAGDTDALYLDFQQTLARLNGVRV
jgi:HK97 family phage prohead protease